MVFGWGKKKSEITPQESMKKQDIQLTEVKKITKDLLNLRHNQTLSEIKSFRNKINPLLKELSTIVNNLEKDNLSVDEIDKHLRIIVVRGKKQVIDVIKKEASSLNEVTSFDDALEVSNTLNQKLKKIGDVLGRQTRVIHIFAKKYAEELKGILADMNSFRSEIQKLIQNFQESKTSFEEISNLLGEVQAIKEDTVEKNTRISELELEINSSQKKIMDLEKIINQIKSSKKYEEFLKTKNNLDSFEDSKHQIIEEIGVQFTKISRPLSRYEYVSSLDKDQKTLLNYLINNPFEALTPSNNDSIIVILENVKKGISSGSISVKDVDKSMTSITETEESLEHLIGKVTDYLEKKKKIQKDLQELENKELCSHEHQLEKLIEQKKDAENKITLFKKDLSENSIMIPQKINNVERLLKKFSNTEYTITGFSEI